jgi:hypothetical protein
MTEDNYFNLIEDDVLIEMIIKYPKAIEKLCVMLSLDLQLEKEDNENISYRRNLC